MISLIIVEDEPVFRDVLLDMLPKANIQTNIISHCSTIQQAREEIKNYKPQLVLLDIELPDGNSLDLLNTYEEQIGFEIIFTTSHDKYAIDAIKKNAADYIVKPVSLNELNNALIKVKKRLDIYEKLLKVEELNSSVNKLLAQNLQSNKIMINTNTGAVFIKVDLIIRLESESNYTIIYLDNNKKLIASKTLSYFEEMLEQYNFMRVHRSCIINLTKILCIINKEGYYTLSMNDMSCVEISRRKKKDFFEKISYNI